MPKYFLSGLLLAIIALPAMSAAGATDDFFAGAPRGDDGRFTNLGGEIGHGTFETDCPSPASGLSMEG